MADVLSFARDAQEGGRVSAFNVTVDVPKGPPPVVDLSFRDEHRLCKTDEFSSVFAFRRTLRGKYFDVLYRPNSSGTARLGVVIAKKLVRSAVGRNLIKRIVRESFRLLRTNLPHRDLVVRVTTHMASPDKCALRGEIDALFDRLAL
ncbi:MAG: ribonuclease P protein component [Betaproteobacteria bacterium]|nr:ribonuclease P protein component [Betaproteobacteria bacterium]